MDDAAKVVTIRVSVGAEDKRSMNDFISDIRDRLVDEASNITSLSEYYLVDGQPIRPDGTNLITGERHEKETKKQARKKAPEPEPEPEPGPEPEEEPEEEEEWCSHNDPSLLPGDTCECGDTVPEPTCEGCDGPWGEDPSCSRCTHNNGRPRPQAEPGPLTKEKAVASLAKKAAPKKISMKKG